MGASADWQERNRQQVERLLARLSIDDLSRPGSSSAAPSLAADDIAALAAELNSLRESFGEEIRAVREESHRRQEQFEEKAREVRESQDRFSQEVAELRQEIRRMLEVSRLHREPSESSETALLKREIETLSLQAMREQAQELKEELRAIQLERARRQAEPPPAAAAQSDRLAAEAAALREELHAARELLRQKRAEPPAPAPVEPQKPKAKTTPPPARGSDEFSMMRDFINRQGS